MCDWLDVPNRVRELFPLCCAPIQYAIKNDLDEFDVPVLGTLYKEGSAFKPVADLWQTAQRPFGGPNPLTAMLLTGAAGAGMGWAGSKALNAVTPNKYIDDKRRARNWAMLGGLAGLALPGYFYARPALQMHGLAGLLQSGEVPPAGGVAAGAKLGSNDPVIQKCAADAGALFAPVVPVDRFNRVVLDDPYLSPELKAATAGLTTAAQLSRGGTPWISPADIGRAAIGMGAGWISGMLVGRTLGALAGLRPEVQQTLQQTGAIAGLISQVVPLLGR